MTKIQPTLPTDQFGKTLPSNDWVKQWVEQTAALTQPDHVFWCDGSEGERKYLTDQAVQQGVLIPLDPKKWPNCYYHHSNPNDVARVEQCTYICTRRQKEAGATNNWMEPKAMRLKLRGMLAGSMKGRTMFVIPYLMGATRFSPCQGGD